MTTRFDIDPKRVNDLDEEGRPPIVVAAYEDNHELIGALLMAGADINAKSSGGKSALFTAVIYGHTDTAKLLLSSGADLFEKDEILLAAVGYRPPLESIRLMLEADANPNYEKQPTASVPGNPPWTPLSQAAAFGTLETVQLLVESGGDIAATPQALVGAVYRGRTDNARYLIDRGADPNVRDSSGNPLLFVALESAAAMIPDPELADVDPWDLQLELVQMLLKKGADPHLRNRDGDTVMQVAVRDNDEGLIRLLRKQSSFYARILRWLSKS